MLFVFFSSSSGIKYVIHKRKRFVSVYYASMAMLCFITKNVYYSSMTTLCFSILCINCNAISEQKCILFTSGNPMYQYIIHQWQPYVSVYYLPVATLCISILFTSGNYLNQYVTIQWQRCVSECYSTVATLSISILFTNGNPLNLYVASGNALFQSIIHQWQLFESVYYSPAATI